ncbi:hypothetical protein FEM48_Zijuj08G0073700 [Ziziphus jujuba var. spinosa]|uniref:Non-haem dioxygenase N-terminal domain-containing protein n=1 Tax=Ziziphus jujuba var. spinosa TaxID=714518 RepID=A0A978UXR6_ZIZJJ|nr:hypothetical protein FEM48_Zijuj08G0073700 [Ziziphus jujuba var. spinosa]
MSEMKTVARSLVDLSMEIKMRNANAIAGRGYIAPNQTNPLYESLGLYDSGSLQAVHSFCAQLHVSSHQRGIGIPVIDLKKFGEVDQDEEEYKKQGEACKEWGCFRIINHNIPMSIMSEMKTVVTSLLDLAMEIKMRNSDIVVGTQPSQPSLLDLRSL